MSAEQCTVDFTLSLAQLFSSESCGKCTPCRVGLRQASYLLRAILEGEGTQDDIKRLEQIACALVDSADCAIGFEAGRLLRECLADFADDFTSHVESDSCAVSHYQYPPCQSLCPAHVDIPRYIALVNEGRYAEALRVIRNDNPLPTVCGYVCEHPCEKACRRSLVDSPVNIVGLKRFAADNAEASAPMPNQPSTGKTVGIVGGGPAGLTTAYFLQLMGHEVTIYEQRPKLGGMVRYGIPDYRLPQDKLDEDVDFILATGVKVEYGISIGAEGTTLDDLRGRHDAVCLAIGAHASNSLGIEGEDARGVLSAVEFLRAAGDGHPLDLTGKRVVIIGGGNVAMDCTRTARRLNASSVECVYRRRLEDMTALPEEVADAAAEGCQLSPLKAPVRIESDSDDNVTGLVVQPQLISTVKRGRPSPVPADAPEECIPCDIILVAIGQVIDSKPFENIVATNRRRFVTKDDGSVLFTSPEDGSVLYAIGDAVSGPATVIKAVAAGKVAAANIDEALGYRHNVYDEVAAPLVKPTLPATGRVDLRSRTFAEAAEDFDIALQGMSAQEASQESARCLHCDHHGFSITCGKETSQW